MARVLSKDGVADRAALTVAAMVWLVAPTVTVGLYHVHWHVPKYLRPAESFAVFALNGPPILALIAIWDAFALPGEFPPAHGFLLSLAVYWLLIAVAAGLVCAGLIAVVTAIVRRLRSAALRRRRRGVRPRRSTIVVFVFVAAAWLLLSVVVRYEVGLDWAHDPGLPSELVRRSWVLLALTQVPPGLIYLVLQESANAMGFRRELLPIGSAIGLSVAVATNSALWATLITAEYVRIRDWPGHRPLRRTRAKSEWETPAGLTAKRVFKIVWFAALVLGMLLLI